MIGCLYEVKNGSIEEKDFIPGYDVVAINLHFIN